MAADRTCCQPITIPGPAVELARGIKDNGDALATGADMVRRQAAMDLASVDHTLSGDGWCLCGTYGCPAVAA